MSSFSLLCFVLISFMLSDGVRGGWTRMGEEDKELSTKLSNEGGDIIDCIDFSKQPAFNHPSFKNQSIQETQISYPDGEFVPRHTISKVALKAASCPSGTVAIRRTIKGDIFRLKSFSTFGGEYIAAAGLQGSTNPPGTHYAVLVSNKGSYRGANALLQVYDISGVELHQYSGTTITVFSGAHGPLDKFNVIVVGWLVHPALYGDNLVRLTIFWTTDGYQHTNCFNLQCPGFIQKSSKYTPGMALSGGLLPLSVYKDMQSGNWILSTSDGNGSEIIGWWPKSIFSSLDGNAEYIEWGGVVMSPLDRKSSPMGNGRFPLYGARVANIEAIDVNNKVQQPSGRLVADRPDCYNADMLANRRTFGWSFYYGGPGGCLG